MSPTAIIAVVLLVVAGASPTGTSAAQKQTSTADSVDVGWPRQLTAGGMTFTMYQPQLDDWQGDRLEAHAAVSVSEPGSEEPTFGVIWLGARTEVDKINRQVYLDSTEITKASFPSKSEKANEWQAALQKQLPSRSKAFSLDRMEAQLAVQQQRAKTTDFPLKNEPPKILVSTVPAMLVIIDGEPALRDAGKGLQRVINTRPLLLKSGDTYYLHVFDGWMGSQDLTATWSVAKSPPKALAKAKDAAVQSGQVDLLTGESGDTTQPLPSLKKPPVPVIHVSTTPAELIVFDGEPNYVPLDSTRLLYAKNTTAQVFKSTADNKTYLVLSGRWYRADSFKAPWSYVPGPDLPDDFAKIPDSSPVENVKAAVPGTPQAEEALIANSIPQTASVKRSTTMNPVPAFDGDPQLEPVAGTSLSYVVNSSVPIIQVGPQSFYAVQNGIWFAGSSARGPWAVATSVPPAIYSIPPSSPIYYVTYVQVYQATPAVVLVGYTPGYYGTVVAPYGVVVYGTGYAYTPWIGTVWYGPPLTYGFGVAWRWTPWTGWSYGYGFGWSWGVAYTTWGGWGWGPRPWWGPSAWGWGVTVGPHGGYARWGPGGWYGTTGNVYTRWGSTHVVSRTSGGFNAWTGNRWTHQVGHAYNSRTGTLAAGQRAAVGNVYTGNYAAGARGVAHNERTGVTAAGKTGTMGNAYTGKQVSGGRGVVYDPRTGERVKVSGVKGENSGAVRIGNTTVARSGGDVYAGHDGEVYRRDDNGNWQRHSENGWTNSQPADRERLDREAGARAAGQSRAEGFNRTGSVARRGGGARRR